MRRFLDTKDRASTGNMKRHAIRCFGQTVVDGSMSSDAAKVRQGLAKFREGTIPAVFEARGNGVVTYKTQALTKVDVR